MFRSVKNLQAGRAVLLVHPQVWHLANRKNAPLFSARGSRGHAPPCPLPESCKSSGRAFVPVSINSPHVCQASVFRIKDASWSLPEKGSAAQRGGNRPKRKPPFPFSALDQTPEPPLCGGWLLLSGAVLQFCFRKEGKPLGVEGKGLLPIFKMLITAFPHFSRAEPGHLHRPEQAPDVPLEEINSGRQAL